MGQVKTLSPRATGGKGRPEQKLVRELEAFERLRPKLLKTHAGLFVAIHRGRVVAADADDFRLGALVEERARREGPIAICQVCEIEEAGEEQDDVIFHYPPMEESRR